MSVQTTAPLTPRFGLELIDADLAYFANEQRFFELRALFEEHSALLVRNQEFSSEVHLRLAGMFGPIEDRNVDEREPGEEFEMHPLGLAVRVIAAKAL